MSTKQLFGSLEVCTVAVFYQAVIMLVMLFFGAWAVAEHDAYGASLGDSSRVSLDVTGFPHEMPGVVGPSPGTEPWLARFGHFQYALFEDIVAGLSLISIAALCFFERRIELRRGAHRLPELARRRIKALLFGIAAFVMSLEFFGELAVVDAQGQLFETFPLFVRGCAVGISGIVGLWSLVLGLFLGFCEEW